MRKKRNVGSAKIELIQWCTTLQFRHPNADILLMTGKNQAFFRYKVVHFIENIQEEKVAVRSAQY